MAKQAAGGIERTPRVTRLAPQNAASVAGLLLNTEAMIAEAPSKEAAGGPPMGGGGGMGGMGDL